MLRNTFKDLNEFGYKTKEYIDYNEIPVYEISDLSADVYETVSIQPSGWSLYCEYDLSQGQGT
jgi:hypothetical protein